MGDIKSNMTYTYYSNNIYNIWQCLKMQDTPNWSFDVETD